ncbi:MAG: RNA polymerase sigma factor [Bacteroidetes bacterium]|nr:RNA polymerase sigma factor [Bacteroidota bacterium]
MKNSTDIRRGMNRSDEEIVVLVLAGATEEYAQLVKKYEKPIFNLMYRFTGDVQEAGDLTQDVFIKSFKKIASLDVSKKYFTWLYTIAINSAKDWLRTQLKTSQNKLLIEGQAIIDRDKNFFGPSGQELTLQTQQETANIYKTLEKLPLEKKEMLIMRYMHELSIHDIAEIFCLSESAVKMRIKRSLEQVQRLLQA